MNIDEQIEVKIVGYDQKHNCLFGTQKDSTLAHVRSIHLLEKGDNIEIRFSERGGLYVPRVKKCYAFIHARIMNYPEDFDYKAKYSAHVTLYVKPFVYDVMLDSKC